MRRATQLILFYLTALHLGITILPLHATPLPNRYAGAVSVANYALGNADILLPLLSDTDSNFYLNPVFGFGSDHQGYADLGLGYRWLQNKASIIGFYPFGGYSRGNREVNLWVANPRI